MKPTKPCVALTMGDPAGIGPEITLATLREKNVYQQCRPFLIGSFAILQRAMAIHGLNLPVNLISHPSAAKFTAGIIDLLEPAEYDCAKIEWGKVQPLAGKMSLDYIMKSIALGLNGDVDIVATAPIHKEAIKKAGCTLPGHTEIFQVETAADYGLTMFNVHNLRVFFVSRHMALKDACDYASKARVLACVQQIDKELRALNIHQPRIAVAALNPHASDNGLFGHEERDNLIPAVEAAQAQGINAIGPVPADSVFHLGKQGRYDAILSLYHDQGHIACKTLDFDRSVTITFGLPFMRSSVDHGTAFDIAGRGKATTISMLESTLVAIRYWQMQQAKQA